MKQLVSLFMIAFGILLSGCIPSLTPATEKNETFLPDAEGQWERNQTRYRIESCGEFYTVAAENKEGGKNFFKMTLTTVGGETYASLTFDGDAPGLKQLLNEDSRSFLLPLWRIYRLQVSEEELRLYWMADESLLRTCFRDLGSIQKAGSEDRILNTSPQQLKAWLAGHPGAYAEKNGNFCSFRRIR